MIQFLEETKNNNIVDYNDNLSQVDSIQRGSRDYLTPETIEVEITDALAYSNDNTMKNDPKCMPEDVFYNILFDMKNMGIDNMHITGGEPLLHPNFFDFLNKAVELGIMCTVSTSGYINNYGIIRAFNKIADHKKVALQINIDGPEKYHDYIRGQKGAYKKSISFISAMSKMGFVVNAGVSVGKQQYTDVRKLAKLLKKKGARAIRICALPSIDWVEGKTISREMKNLRRICGIVSRLKYELEDSYFMVNKCDEAAAQYESYDLMNYAFNQVVRIDCCGKAYSAGKANIVIGNVCEETIKSIQIRSFKNLENARAQTILSNKSEKTVAAPLMINNYFIDNKTEKPNEWYSNRLKIVAAIRDINNAQTYAK